MRDVRISALKKAVEVRWPGTLVIWQPYRSPDDPLIRGWVRIFDVPIRDQRTVERFARELAWNLFPGPSRFFVSTVDPENEAAIRRRLGLRPRGARDRRQGTKEMKGARKSRSRPTVRARA